MSAEDFGQGTLTRPPTGAQTIFGLSGEKTAIWSDGEIRLSEIQSLRKFDLLAKEKFFLINNLLELTVPQLKLKLQSFVILQKSPPPHGTCSETAHFHLQKHAFITQVDYFRRHNMTSFCPSLLRL